MSFISSLKRMSQKKVDTPLEDEIVWGEIKNIKLDEVFANEFTPDLFPESLYNYCIESSKCINNAKPDYVATSLLVSGAALIGGSCCIRPKGNDKSWEIKPTLWSLNIGDPSSFKTPLTNKGKAPLIYAQKNHIDICNIKNKHRQDIENKLIEQKTESIKQKIGIKIEQDDNDAIEELLDELSSLELKYDAERRVIFNDLTPESLLENLMKNPRGILLERDEIKGLFLSMNKSGREELRSILLHGFNATDEPYIIDRIGRERQIVNNVHISILGGIQPDVLKPFLLDRENGNNNDGFIERFQIAVYPKHTNLEYIDESIDTTYKDKVNEMFIKLAKFSERETMCFDFDDDAQRLWDSWSKEFINKIQTKSGKELSIYIKYQALFAKLAMIFHIFTEIETCPDDNFNIGKKISLEHLKMAFKWEDYLLSHSKKIMSIVKNDYDGSVQTLINKLPTLGGAFTKHFLSQRGWSNLKDSSERDRALQVLEDHGYIKQVTYPKRMYKVNPILNNNS
ncbi:DUF3987 domain-containing protein [Vibrio fluvialis]|nr:DUF3987 domain-containing protein [Vibrio fluvialis]